MSTHTQAGSFVYSLRAVAALVLLCVCSPSSHAQSPSQSNTVPSRATTLPLSGTDSTGVVNAVQQTAPDTTPTSNVITTIVTAQHPYNGSTPSASPVDGTLSLTLEAALNLGLRTNLGALAQSAAVQQAQGQREVARSTLLPRLDTAISEEFERTNLRTQGVEVATFPESVQFNFFDARAVRLNQSVFDLVQLRNLHSATQTLQANIHAARNARDLIVLAVGGSYLQLIATNARIDATAAQVLTDQAIFQQAADRLDAGLATRVDVTRTQVQLQVEQQRLRSLHADLDTQKLRLARIIGLALGQNFTIADDFHYTPVTLLALDAALPAAFKNRSDLQAAAAGVRAAEAALKAAHAEYLPTLTVSGDFGAAGVTPSHEATAVYSAVGTLNIPLYQGGRVHGDIDQAAAALKQRKAEFEDLRGQVDQDVRQAFIDLDSAADQVIVSQSNVDLSHQTLTQSRDRFAAGVADTVELVQSEQSVAQADDDFITAVYQHNLAKVSLARAMGNAEQALPQLLRK